jgi:hypothetical protein
MVLLYIYIWCSMDPINISPPNVNTAIYQHQPDPSWVMTYPKGFHQGIEPSTDHGEYDGDKAIDPPGIQHG